MIRRRQALLVLSVALGLFVWLRVWGMVVDDTAISLRYAMNLAEGYGLVFNEGERVEGYTNFTWCVSLALFARLGVPIEFAARCLGILCCALTFFVALRLSRRTGGDPIVVGLVLASTPGLAYWSGAGLETMGFAWLWIASRSEFHRMLRGERSWLLVVTLVLLPLTRPDGVLAVASALIVGVVASSRERRGVWVRVALMTMALGAIYAGWKLWYFGDILPTTFHAKNLPIGHALMSGAGYIGRAVFFVPLIGLALGLAHTAVAGPAPVTDQATRALARLLVVDIVVAIAWSWWVGGDGFPFYRFVICAVPPAAVLLGWTVSGRRSVAFVVLFAVWGAAGSIVGPSYRHALTSDRIADVGAVVGEWLGERLPEGEALAVNAAGYLPYRSGRRTIDMLGLTDRTIAMTPLPDGVDPILGHSRANGEYVLGLAPAVIILGNTTGDRSPLYRSGFELWIQPEFRQNYSLVSVPLSVMSGTADKSQLQVELLGFFIELIPGRDSEVDSNNGLAFYRERAGLTTIVDVAAVDTDVHLWVRSDLLPAFSDVLIAPR